MLEIEQALQAITLPEAMEEEVAEVEARARARG
jgi:hypothetical protein